MADYEISLKVTEEAKDLVVDEGFDEEYGARLLRRAILVNRDPISEALLEGRFKAGDTIEAYSEEGEIKFKNA